MHGGIEGGDLDAVPEGAPDEPGLVVVVDDEVGIDGVPVVALLLGSHDAALIIPQTRCQGAGAQKTDGRAVASEGGTAISEPPATVPPDDVRGPDMGAEARHGVVGPFGDDRHHRLRMHRPLLAVLRSHVLDTHAGGKDMPGAVFESHHRVVHHGRRRGEGLSRKAMPLPLCRNDTAGKQHQGNNKFPHILTK